MLVSVRIIGGKKCVSLGLDKKILLDEDRIPKKWYCINPDLPAPMKPLLDPKTLEPVDPKMLEAIFPRELLKQEMSMDRFIEIPEEIRDIYRLWRPTPMYRAYGLEKALKTPAKIYYKYEGVSPPGSHKPNTAVAQAYYNMKAGTEKLTTETGAGQWGSSLSFACNLFDMDLIVYMVKISYQQKPYRKSMMQLYGAEVYPSPSPRTEVGRRILKEHPESTGSLGVAISEAVEECLQDDNTKYSLGSVLNHVMLHQTIIGLETKQVMEAAGEYPDIIVGCIGGGSNFAGMFLPFVKDKIDGTKPDLRIINVEPASCPTLTKGPYAYDFGDVAGMTPLLKMFTLGHDFMPPPIHAGGLRYHGMAPIICHLYNLGLVEARAEHQLETFKASITFARNEGIISAPEPTHAIKVVIDEALKCKESGEAKTILLAHSGHGHVDMAAYDDYLSGKLSNYEYPDEKIDAILSKLPKVA